MEPLLCTVCGLTETHDHRWCIVGLFKENKIQSVKEWEDASRLLAKKRQRRRIRVLLPKE